MAFRFAFPAGGGVTLSHAGGTPAGVGGAGGASFAAALSVGAVAAVVVAPASEFEAPGFGQPGRTAIAAIVKNDRSLVMEKADCIRLREENLGDVQRGESSRR